MTLYGYCWNVGDAKKYISIPWIIDILDGKNDTRGNEERNVFVYVCVCVHSCMWWGLKKKGSREEEWEEGRWRIAIHNHTVQYNPLPRISPKILLMQFFAFVDEKMIEPFVSIATENKKFHETDRYLWKPEHEELFKIKIRWERERERIDYT